jgi:hypothetical protein
MYQLAAVCNTEDALCGWVHRRVGNLRQAGPIFKIIYFATRRCEGEMGLGEPNLYHSPPAHTYIEW